LAGGYFDHLIGARQNALWDCVLGGGVAERFLAGTR
jgi:hypothetical protein